ncbi:glutathione S-transferase family protein [Sphingomonas sp. BT-65]|uniref:glutathione S-transferase family protein n=1 Tax=Sphingomonas sp. BT-65 TaxID=2989821 RepID=UPI002236AC71|nr:glutathione S-transferase family protein [Sphingomonas sp. BT-65]MCW4462535.1 glutathione S-transferase family protein [Sphingomonas sp. BT-65]
MILYGHPFSSYCQKALIAFYETATAFEFRVVGPDPAVNAEFEALWPLKRFPVLVDDEWTLPEASIIVEHIAPHFVAGGMEARLLDRVFDNYVMTPLQKIVGDALRPDGARDPHGVAEARATLDKAYAWLDAHMAGRQWAAGDFGLADCAAGPSLFYADWAHPIPDACAALRAYRGRLVDRPSFARAIDEAREFRRYFPLGAPDRD